MASDAVELHPFPAVTALPLLVLRGAVPPDGRAAETCERLFAANGWGGGWRNGIYSHHHFHATAHEVLGIARGEVRVRFGGPAGAVVAVRAGDVIVVPAGVSHCNEGASDDLLVIGAYPARQSPEVKRGTPAEHPGAAQQIAAVPLPGADPVYGRNGPLLQHWPRPPR